MSFEADAAAVGRQADQVLQQTNALLDAADVKVGTLEQQVSDLQAGALADGQIIAGLQADKVALSAEVARLLAILYPPPPPPPPPTAVKGASAGGSQVTIAAAVKKWPSAAILRCFTSDATYVAPSWLPKGVTLAFSNKPNLIDFAAGKYDQQELAWGAAVTAAGIKARRIIYHEPDVKMNSTSTIGGFTIAQWQAAQDHLADLHADNASVTVSIVVAAHCLTGPNAGRTVESWMRPKVHSYGFDFDGNRNTALPYVDYTPEVTRMAQIKALGVDVWVGELGVPHITADTGDTIRAKWLTNLGAAVVKAGASAVCLFDTAPEGPLSGVTLDAWTAFLRS